MIAYESEHVEVAPAQERAQRAPGALKQGRIASRLWAARGFFGGLLAIGLAIQGQLTVLHNSPTDSDLALRYYLAAFFVAIATLLYPGPLRLRRKKPVDPGTQFATVPGALPVRVVASPGAPVIARARRKQIQAEKLTLATLWPRWKALRARLGLRVTVAGLLLTGLLAGAATWLLYQDVGSIAGGWLWFAALLVLLVTFAGAEGWPLAPGGHPGLLPGPRSDAFARGLPAISPRWEAVLVGLILVAALVSRVYNLEYFPGIYGDEGERGIDGWSTVEGQGGPIFGYGWWSVPKLYAYIVGFFLHIFGRTMVGDRMLSVISGMVCVWFVYKTGRLLWGPRVGLIAGGLLAASPFALQISRQASESAPTQALWTAGFYFLFMALRYRRPLDWALSGTLWGFSLYFYASGKLIIGVAAVVIFYCLVRWRSLFFKRYALGFVLLVVAMALVFLPNFVFNIKDNWYNFTYRSQETSLFAPGIQMQVFQHYGIPYEGTWAMQPLLQNITSHLGPWMQVMIDQVRVSTEVLYRSGDPSGHYAIFEHNGSLLSPLLAAIALIGLAYGAWKIFDARFGLLNIWFWGGMLGVILTMDDPKIERMVGAWPVLMLFPAVLLDRVAASAWPLNASIARRWAAVPLVCLMLFLGYDGYREYFVHYASLCPFCKSTTAARYTQDLGSDYKGYMLGVSDGIFFGYGSARYIAPGVEGVDVTNITDFLPVTDDGKGLAFMVYPGNVQYLPLLESTYPGGKEEEIKGSDGVTYFTSYKVSKDLLAALRTATATYTGADGHKVTRNEPNLGSKSGWLAPGDLKYPATATWEGGLVAPAYAVYTFRASGTKDVQLVVDGRPLALSPAGGQQNGNSIEVIMAKGLHTVRVSGTLSSQRDRLDFTWASGKSAGVPVGADYLLRSYSGGLEVDAANGTDPGLIANDNPFGPAPVSNRVVYGITGLRQAAEAFGNTASTTRWKGTLKVATPGAYTFQAYNNGPLILYIDGYQVINNTSDGTIPIDGVASLSQGEHTLEMRAAWGGGTAPVELYWMLQGTNRSLIPPSALGPAAGIWLPGEVPEPQGTVAFNLASGSDETSQPVTPEAHFGAGDLKDPHGIAVDGRGNVYVGDSGNDRIVVFSPDGKVLREWGKPAVQGQEANPGPGAFSAITNIALGRDGTVYVLDKPSGVQAFTPEGKFKWGTGAQKYGLYSPNGIGIASDGNLLIADTGQSRILKMSSETGASLGELRGANSDLAPLNQPFDTGSIGTDIFGIDLNNRVVQVDQTGKITTEWALHISGNFGGSRLATSRNGHIYVSDPDRARWVDIDTATGVLNSYGTKGTGDGRFDAPTGIGIGPYDRIYMLDVHNGVQVFAPPAGK